MKRVLLTGATGFIGRQVLAGLRTAGYEVHAVTSGSCPPPQLASMASSWSTADLLDPGTPARVVVEARAEALLHLAWSVKPGGNDDESHQEWLQASESLVTAFYEAGGTRVVAAGSCFEYDWSEGVCREEETPKIPTTSYGQCKDALRRFLESSGRDHGRSWAWGRIFFAYGPGERPDRFVPAIITGLLRNERVACSHGRQVRDYLYSQDIAGAFQALLESDFTGACNIASGRGTSLFDLGTAIGKMLEKQYLIDFGAREAVPGEPPEIVADVRRLTGEIGWRPQVALQNGLSQSIAWWKEELEKVP